MTSTAILIPARYESSRFPGKPLCDLDGTPMIQRVFNKCWDAGFDPYVLTDDERVAEVIPEKFVHLDKRDFANGTARCSGALEDVRFDKYDTFINVQGDMPDVTTDMISKCFFKLNQGYGVSTIYTELSKDQKDDPNTVKIVTDKDRAVWFGRGISGYGAHHLGVYAFKREFLVMYKKYYVSEAETAEDLEQLRWIMNDIAVGAARVDFNGIEINTPKDAKEWNKVYGKPKTKRATNLRKSK